MVKFNKKVAITTGDVNGIGAEITVKALNSLALPQENVVIISNKKVLDFYGKLNINYEIVEINYDSDIIPSAITKESGDFSYKALKKACEMAKTGEINAIVTAPVSKEALHLSGHKFNGQTEILQEFLAHDNQKAEMLFVADDFRVLLLTRHVALNEINLSKEKIVEQVTNLDEFFKTHLHIKNPKFALCSLNPHAGENGILGKEEIKILNPAVEILKKKNINITNSLPADTLFIGAAKTYLKSKVHQPINSSTYQLYDCYIACYHDQGLIPIKTVAAEKTVNMTIGLDIIRTSPSHGTAFDIAGKNQASELSMIEAIKAAFNS